jgi:hypothetical protein
VYKNDFNELDLHAFRDIRNLKTPTLAKLKADKGIVKMQSRNSFMNFGIRKHLSSGSETRTGFKPKNVGESGIWQRMT